MSYVIALDAGTGSVRAILFNQNGKEIASSQKEWFHHAEINVPGSMTFDTEHNWLLVMQCIQEILDQSRVDKNDILAVSAASMREGIVVYDRHGQVLWACANVDARCSEEVILLKSKPNDLESLFYQQSGQTFALGAAPRLLWLKRNRPKLFEQIDKVSMLSDWILFKLSGEIISEPSNASTSGLFSLQQRQWSSELMRQAGLPDFILPKCLESGSVIGVVKSDIAQSLGLSIETKVVAGGGDVQLGSLGVGLINSGDVGVFGGSFWQSIVNMDVAKVDPNKQIRINSHVVVGQYQAEAIAFFTGMVMRWFKYGFCETEVQQEKITGISAYTLLEQQAMNVPAGSYGIIPLFSDAMHYDHWIHGSPSFLGLSLDHQKCNKYSLFRALQENAAIVVAENLSLISQFTPVNSDILTFASGASKGMLWPQIVADVTGRVVRIPVIKEATALGTAMIAGLGVHWWDNMDQATQQWVHFERTIEPNLQNRAVYDELREKWKIVYAQNLTLVKHKVLEPMWAAPGCIE